MIPNVNQFTEQLRMMPDQALQRVAMMYKNDPYILPLVVSEDMARKKMRMAAQAQMAQPQPKVVDQALMGMGQQPPQAAPGLAALQAPNMERMADGGIAGYADGGDMDFADRNEPVVRMAEGGAVQRFQQGGQARYPGLMQYGDLATGQARAGNLLPTTTGYEGMSITEFLKAAYNDVSDAVKRLYDKIPKESLAQVVAEDLEKQKQRERKSEPLTEPPLINPETGKPYIITAVPATAATGLREPGAPASAVEPTQTRQSAPTASAAPRAAVPATAPSEGGIYSLAGRLFDPAAQELKTARGRAVLEAQRRGDEELAAYEAGKPKGKIAEGLEAAIRKEEAGAEGERKEAAAMAIFNAGLAMMAGSSPRALENIGKGAMVGTAQYSDALKDMKKAAKERQKMLADIEGARRAEERDDNKTALTLMQRANDRQERAEMFFTEGSMKLGMTKGEVAGRLYGTQMETESRERTARANDPLALFRVLGDGDVAKGYERAQSVKREPMTKERLYLEYMKNPMNDPAKFGDFVKQFEGQFGPLGGVSGAASQSADEALVQQWLKPPR